MATCQEAVGVVGQVGDNRVDDLLREPCGRRTTCGRGIRRDTPKGRFLDLGETSIPDALHEQFDRCKRNKVVSQRAKGRIVAFT